jgi:hypothetical protein
MRTASFSTASGQFLELEDQLRDPSKIEAMLNHVHISDLFSSRKLP